MQIPRDYEIPHPSRYKLRIRTREVWTASMSDAVELDVGSRGRALLQNAGLNRPDEDWFGNDLARVTTDVLGAIQGALISDPNDSWSDKPDA